MSFARQLQTLLDIYRVSNAALARGIGVDASLVSRWKTGNRLPPSAHRVAREIAGFLSGLPLRSHDKSFLMEALGPGAATVGIATAMEKYLLDIRIASPVCDVIGESEALLSGLCALLQKDGASALRGPVNLWPRVQKGQPLEHEAFFDIDGKRQAAVNFLYTALSAHKRTEMYLLLPEGMDWITESASFASLFFHALYTFVQRGGVITLIHRQPEDTHELFSVLSGLSPHYLTGRVRSYSMAGRSYPPAPTLFVASGLCATAAFRQAGSETTVLYRNATDAARLENLFRDHLAEADPLARACDGDDPLAIPSTLAELERRSGDCYVATRALNPLWAPESLLQEHARQAPGAAALLARRRESLLSHTGRWIEMWSEELLLGIERKGCAMFSLETFSGNADVTLSGEALNLYLSGVVNALRAHERIQLLITPSLLNVGYLACKKRAGALLVPASDISPPSALQLHGEGALTLINSWCSARAGAAQNKRQVVARLEAAQDRLRRAGETA